MKWCEGEIHGLLCVGFTLDFLNKHIDHFGDLNSFDFTRVHFFLADIVNAVVNFELSQEFGHRAGGDIQIGNKTSYRVSTPAF